VVRCNEEMFDTSFEKQYLKKMKERGNVMYCLTDDNVVLQGTMDSEVQKKSYSYVIYIIKRCHDEIRNKTLIQPSCDPTIHDCRGCNPDKEICAPVDPECAPETDIDNWTKTKRVYFTVLNDKIDFNKYKHDEVIRQSEHWFPSIGLKKGVLNDTGYRFRKNVFNRDESWHFFRGEHSMSFYDVKHFNTDPLDVSPDETTLAEMYFRIDID